MEALLQLAAIEARDGHTYTAALLKRAFDDLRGTPILPKGMHTN